MTDDPKTLKSFLEIIQPFMERDGKILKITLARERCLDLSSTEINWEDEFPASDLCEL